MNSGFDMYKNSGYVNTRNRKKTLILDIDLEYWSWADFKTLAFQQT